MNNVHKEQASKSIQYFKSEGGCFKRVRLDAGGIFHQANFSFVKASYVVALCFAKAKKPHTIAETLVKPCLLDREKIVVDDKAYNKIKQVFLSNDIIKNRIVEMSSGIIIQLISVVASPALPFAIQLDESTDVANLSQLLVYIRYVSGASIKEDF